MIYLLHAPRPDYPYWYIEDTRKDEADNPIFSIHKDVRYAERIAAQFQSALNFIEGVTQ